MEDVLCHCNSVDLMYCHISTATLGVWKSWRSQRKLTLCKHKHCFVVLVLGHLLQLFDCGCIIYITRKHLLKRLRRAVGYVRGHSQRSNGREVDVGQNAVGQTWSSEQFFQASVITIIPISGYVTTICFTNLSSKVNQLDCLSLSIVQVCATPNGGVLHDT